MANKRILIIDDDDDILESTSSLLNYEGFEVQTAETVEKGIQMISRNAPDLVLLDIMFPEKKTRGFEAAAEIKALNPKLPIFAFTAINREYAFDFAAEDIKADEFINKPIETNKLVAMIRSYLEHEEHE